MIRYFSSTSTIYQQIMLYRLPKKIELLAWN